ncbi:MAG: hypothetical protein P1P86_01545 [Bacteroidales bacterium]|nr:hypothetical protein [Bacteroidales bacterium]
MKRIILISAIAMAAGLTSNAQLSIVIQNNDKVFESSKIDTIINHVEQGDTIYLPGGSIVLSAELRIDKEVHIIGAGHYPDSTSATSFTNISGYNIRFMPVSDNSSFTGINLYYDLYIGGSMDDSISNISILRSSINNVFLGYANARNLKNTFINLRECVVRGSILGGDVQHVLLQKCLINGRIDNFTDNAVFKNNVFLYLGSYSVFRTCSGLSVSNNIFVRDDHGLTASEINNNLFRLNIVPVSGTNMGSGNIVYNAIDTLFINSDGDGLFSYETNYHLHPDCDGIAAGTDGTDIGIYGTTSPYKEGAVPFNPHIRFSDIKQRRRMEFCRLKYMWVLKNDSYEKDPCSMLFSGPVIRQPSGPAYDYRGRILDRQGL